MSNFFFTYTQQAYTLAKSDQKLLDKRLERTEKSDWEIQETARRITVKISSDDYNTVPVPASGVIIDEKKITIGNQPFYVYLVLTNHHVVRDRQAKYRVETVDGRMYNAVLHPEYHSKFSKTYIDLDLLYFFSPVYYQKAELGNSATVKNLEEVFVAGFACPDPNFCTKESKLILEPGTALRLDKELVEFYQIGYTSNTKSGNSGGAVLNKQAKLVAIHGEGKYGSSTQYKYRDGSEPSPQEMKLMQHFSWGIPINTYQKYSLPAPLDVIDWKQLPAQSLNTEYIVVSNDHASSNREWLNFWTWLIIVLVVLLVVGMVYFLMRNILFILNKKLESTLAESRAMQINQDYSQNLQTLKRMVDNVTAIINELRKLQPKEDSSLLINKFDNLERNIISLDTGINKQNIPQGIKNLESSIKSIDDWLKNILNNQTKEMESINNNICMQTDAIENFQNMLSVGNSNNTKLQVDENIDLFHLLRCIVISQKTKLVK